MTPAAVDELSALTAAQFAAQCQLYHAIAPQAAAFHDMFVNTLASSAGSYAATEATNAVATANSKHAQSTNLDRSRSAMPLRGGAH
ncbi:hypothetical protein B1987_25290 [Mycobacterium kansasii]|nr:hypothetical protein B1987_25290 [Mycobacterium kansasii]